MLGLNIQDDVLQNHLFRFVTALFASSLIKEWSMGAGGPRVEFGALEESTIAEVLPIIAFSFKEDKDVPSDGEMRGVGKIFEDGVSSCLNFNEANDRILAGHTATLYHDDDRSTPLTKVLRVEGGDGNSKWAVEIDLLEYAAIAFNPDKP